MTSGRAFALALGLALTLGSAGARAQDRGSDVGGAVAKRKVTKMPVLVRFVDAEYPPERKARGESAAVVLTLEISASGEVASVTVAESAGADFDGAAVKAARGFVFEPAEVDGRPAPSKILYRYSFVIAPAPAPPPPPPLQSPPSAPPPPPPSSAPVPPSGVEEVVVVGAARVSRDATATRVSAAEGKRIAFLHPASTHGVLIELSEY